MVYYGYVGYLIDPLYPREIILSLFMHLDRVFANMINASNVSGLTPWLRG
ncbi:hypothetical protein [Caldivirga sp. UBA161]|nr:hypothetical protein [Caldivirga sp. UBA161]